LLALGSSSALAIVSRTVAQMWHFWYRGDTKVQISSVFLKDSMARRVESCILY
jgi:hypothetical protein